MDGFLLVDVDGFTGIETWIKRDGDKTIVREVLPDISPFLEQNARERAHGDGYSESRDVLKAASVHPIVARQIERETGIRLFDPNHKDGVKRLLNDIDWRKLRTGGGRL